MVKDFYRTTNRDHTDLIVLLDKDDEYVGIYLEKLPSWVKCKVYDREGDKTLTTEIINRAFEENNSYDYYSVTNDDIHYLTEGWDEALCKRMRISCGQDNTMVAKYGLKRVGNVNPGEFPITSVIDGDICREIGWLQYPELCHSCGDNIWFWIGKRSNCLWHDARYQTEHRSAYFGLGESDETFKRCNAIDNMEDYYIYKEWLKYKSGREVIKVSNLLKRCKEQGEKECLDQVQEVKG